jgi:hypothetical protein
VCKCTFCRITVTHHHYCWYTISLSLSHIFTSFQDKNQYVHRRDSVSLASLSEQEIQKRIQLGLVTPSIANPSGGSGSSSAMMMQEATTATDNDDDDDVELEDWQDIPENDKITPDDNGDVTYGDSSSRNGSTTGDLYIVDTQRRSSIDLEHMSINLHDTSMVMNAQPHNGITTGVEVTTSNTTRGGSLYDNNPHKRLRYRQSSIASISEEEPMVRSNSHNNITSSADGGVDPTISTPLDDEEIATVDGSCNEDDDEIDSMEIRDN